MKGNSGAALDFRGDFVVKTCSQAKGQVAWFREAEKTGIIPGFRLPQVEAISESQYRIEYIAGFSATMLTSVSEFKKLVDLAEHWASKPSTTNATWDSYLERLQNHVAASNSPLMQEAFDVVVQYNFPRSFCHGDLTLENVLVTGEGELVLIDPNYSFDLYQSWILDLGKLLQSTNSDYHRVFNSSPGVDPRPHLNYLRGYLQNRGLWKVSLVSELSHIMRLRRYRPEGEHQKVDQILVKLMKEIANCPEAE